MSSGDLNERHPLRHPAWRYERIMECLDSSRTTGSTRAIASDRISLDAYRFFRALRRAGSEYAREKVCRRQPGLYYAWQLHETEETTSPMLIQCRILARETDEQIAQRHGTIPETIAWYEALFFNVRDRLANRDYITRVILRSSPPRAGGLHEFACKFFAYFGGSAILDAVLTGWTGPVPTDPSQLEQFFERYLLASIKRRAAMHADWFAINQYNIIQVLDLAMRTIQEERKLGKEGSDAGDPRAQLLLALQSLPFTAGGLDPALRGMPVQPCLSMAAELKPEELLRAAAGELDPQQLEQPFPSRPSDGGAAG